MARKRALIVGINYPGTNNELRGCVNDANLINETIRDHYGFTDIRMLLDNEATTNAMLTGLNWLVDGAVAGDILYFHYSGHGSQMLDRSGDEADGLDEIICPVDLDWNTKVITDDQLKAIFDKVPNGVNLTVTLDCCNSGGGLDQTNQYQALGQAAEEREAEGRYLPPPKYTPEQLAEGEKRLGFKKRALQRNVDATGLLISGCQAHQTSADAYINGGYIGACTYYLVKSLKDHGWSMSYKELVDDLNNDLVRNGYTQRPELNGPSQLFSEVFLQTSGTMVDAPAQTTVAPIQEAGGKKKSSAGIIIVAALVIAAIAFGAAG